MNISKTVNVFCILYERCGIEENREVSVCVDLKYSVVRKWNGTNVSVLFSRSPPAATLFFLLRAMQLQPGAPDNVHL